MSFPATGEKRVAITPPNVKDLTKKGATVQVQKDAGLGSGFADSLYTQAGASIVNSADEIYKNNDLIVKLRAPSTDEAKKVGNKKILGMLGSRFNADLVDQLSKQGATAIDLTMLLRTLSRGQSFDVLSSQANVAGYRAVIEAAHFLQRPFAGQMTAAGRINPARVLVVGAGVAGLAAIQQAKNMNAVVSAFDVRTVAKEQVESMRAKVCPAICDMKIARYADVNVTLCLSV